MGYACVQGQLAFVQVVVSHWSAPIETDCVNPWMFEMSYAWEVEGLLPVSMVRGAGGSVKIRRRGNGHAGAPTLPLRYQIPPEPKSGARSEEWNQGK